MAQSDTNQSEQARLDQQAVQIANLEASVSEMRRQVRGPGSSRKTRPGPPAKPAVTFLGEE